MVSMPSVYTSDPTSWNVRTANGTRSVVGITFFAITNNGFSFDALFDGAAQDSGNGGVLITDIGLSTPIILDSRA